jgi:hypothetical protein
LPYRITLAVKGRPEAFDQYEPRRSEEMRKFLNAWLRRWAEASLRNELHEIQNALIRQQEIKERMIAESQEQAKAHKSKLEILKRNHKKASAHGTKLIKALRERMSEEMFLSTAAYVRMLEECKTLKP